MAGILLPRKRLLAPVTQPAAADVPGLIGLVHCSSMPLDLMTRGAIFTRNGTPPIVLTSAGSATQVNSTSLGIASNPVRKGMPGWEIGVFTYLAYWQIDSYVGGTANHLGYVNGGQFGEAFGTGTRRYIVGATAVNGGGSWPLGSPFSSALTFDGTNMQGYFNGVSDGALTAASTNYGTFSGLAIGHTSDVAGFNGRMHYLALFNRVLSKNEIQNYAKFPFSIYANRERRIYGGFAGVAPDNLFAQSCL